MAELDAVFGNGDTGLNNASMDNRLAGNLKNDNNQYNANTNIYPTNTYNSEQPQINSVPVTEDNNKETDAAIEKIQNHINYIRKN